MPNKDPDKEAEYQARWRAAHPDYHRLRGDRKAARLPVISRTQALREDLAQQRELARLSRRAADKPEAVRKREMQWIAISSSLAETFEQQRHFYGGKGKVDPGG